MTKYSDRKCNDVNVKNKEYNLKLKLSLGAID